ncbi:hypothetical protein QAD02_004898 [Eretmocerus hayati]|uniref:Uncharacterized protein n=1 Tax=Eretmocerus hayati TaxID=131215 RepID=A0ACC2NRX9_9HYME|nr:hypothetical protein QAD02_004898 [Eretmocerus hayati]
MILIILLLCFSSIAPEGVGKFEIREIGIGPDDVIQDEFAVREDGSLNFIICRIKSFMSSINCTVRVVGLTPLLDEVHLFMYQSDADRDNFQVDFKFDLIKNVLYGWIYEEDRDHYLHRAGIAVNLTTNAVYKFVLPFALENNDEKIVQDKYTMIIDPKGLQLVFHDDPKVCGGLTKCKFVFNSEGELLEGPVTIPYDLNLVGFIPKMRGSKDDGTMLLSSLSESGPKYQAIYYEGSGDSTIVHTFDEIPKFFSNNHDLYLICGYDDHWPALEPAGSLDCAQYDWKTNETVTLKLSDVEFGKNSLRSQIALVANLDKSRFLIAVLGCVYEEVEYCKKFLRISSFNWEGKLLNTVPIFNDLKYFYSPLKPMVTIKEIEIRVCIYLIHDTFVSGNKFAESNIKCFPDWTF